jgi:hypothetical protein
VCDPLYIGGLHVPKARGSPRGYTPPVGHFFGRSFVLAFWDSDHDLSVSNWIELYISLHILRVPNKTLDFHNQV